MMWVWKRADGTPYELPSKTLSPTRCPLCGQYFKKGEREIVIVPPMSVRNLSPKLRVNAMVHRSEWEQLSAGITNDEDMATAFLKHKTPRKAPFTREEEAAMNAFVSACHTLGFWGARELPYGRRCNRQGTGYLEYNAYMDSIEFVSRVRKPGLFDAFYEREIVAKVFTKMHSILNDGRRDDYSAAQSIQKVTQQVEKSMNEIFG
jgi:hypothetical protein